MPEYRRARISGGTYFFTVVTHQRRPLFSAESNRLLLREVIRDCQRDWIFALDAIVLLPDHLHALWTLPPGDDRYSARWSVIKTEFTKRFLNQGGSDLIISEGKQRERRRGVWQRRFWEHTIKDQTDFENHLNYIHYNPVKHGYVKCPKDWEASSFHRWVKAGVYPANWACGKLPPPLFPQTKDDYGEAAGDREI